MKKDNLIKCVKICERAEEMLFGKEQVNTCYGNRMSRMMDLESAVEQFHICRMVGQWNFKLMHDLRGMECVKYKENLEIFVQ